MNDHALAMLRAPSLRLIVLGGSAGGIEAVASLLAAIPPEAPTPVLITLHIAAGSKANWPLVFRDSGVPVVEAEDEQLARPGCAYVAPPDYHLLVDVSGRLSLSSDERVQLARPSVDVMFESAAWSFEAGVLGIVVSGANADGAAGLAAIWGRGGSCWVQRPETALALPTPAPSSSLPAVAAAVAVAVPPSPRRTPSWLAPPEARR